MPIGPIGAKLIGSGLGAISSIFGASQARAGQEAANAANLRIARENREWQERMSNTAYQRASQDLQAAGLNRILALGKPASTPAGNIATMQNPKAAYQAAGQNIANIAANTALQIAQAKNLNARTEALGGAAAVGTKLGELVNWITGKTGVGEPSKGDTPLEYGGMWDQLKNDAKKLYEMISRPKSDYVLKNTTISERENAEIDAQKFLQEIKGTDHYRQMLDQVNKMDIPQGLTDDQKVLWGLSHPEEVKRAMERQRNYQ